MLEIIYIQLFRYPHATQLQLPLMHLCISPEGVHHSYIDHHTSVCHLPSSWQPICGSYSSWLQWGTWYGTTCYTITIRYNTIYNTIWYIMGHIALWILQLRTDFA